MKHIKNMTRIKTAQASGDCTFKLAELLKLGLTLKILKGCPKISGMLGLDEKLSEEKLQELKPEK